MYSLQQIISMNNNATQKAKKEKVNLYIATCNRDINIKSCPVIGDYIPKKWKLINSYFVDSSGFGREGEGALTFNQLLEKVKKGNGYGIGETGQFQLYIHEFEKIEKKG